MPVFYGGWIDETGENDTGFEVREDDFVSAVAWIRVTLRSRDRFAIYVGDEHGPDRRIAFFAGDQDPLNNNDEGVQILRVLEPACLPEEWQPGSAPITIRAGTRDTNERTQTFKPVLAPELEQFSFVMEPVGARGGAYPRPLTTYVQSFRDTSYGNDVTDSIAFAVAGVPYKVFIQPAKIFERATEADPIRYVMYELQNDDGDVAQAIGDDDVNWSETFMEVESPEEFLRVIAEMASVEDPLKRRTAMLDLKPSRESARKRAAHIGGEDLYERAKLLRQEIDDNDPRINPRGRRARARKNPAGDYDQQEQFRLAKEKFEEFHRYEPHKIFSAKTPMPTRVRELGASLFVLYESKKNDPDTGLPVKDAIRYIHEHDSAGVATYTPVSSGGVEVPAWIRETTSVVRLGKCLGYAWTDDKGKERETKIRPTPELYTTPCGRALLVIQDRREVIAMVWGGALGVESRGIVG